VCRGFQWKKEMAPASAILAGFRWPIAWLGGCSSRAPVGDLGDRSGIELGSRGGGSGGGGVLPHSPAKDSAQRLLRWRFFCVSRPRDTWVPLW